MKYGVLAPLVLYLALGGCGRYFSANDQGRFKFAFAMAANRQVNGDHAVRVLHRSASITNVDLENCRDIETSSEALCLDVRPLPDVKGCEEAFGCARLSVSRMSGRASDIAEAIRHPCFYLKGPDPLDEANFRTLGCNGASPMQGKLVRFDGDTATLKF